MIPGAYATFLLFLVALNGASAGVIEWSGYGAAEGCVKWSDACWRHYGVHVMHAWNFSRMLSIAERCSGVIYVPGGWHPEYAWPSHWKTDLLQLPYLKYLGVCAGSFTFALGGATYYTNANKWPPKDYFTNGLTVAWGMLGPGIYAPYRSYVLGCRTGTIIYWNGPLFAPEPGADVVLVGPSTALGLETPVFVRRIGDEVWAWVLDLKVRIHGVVGYGCALGVIYDIVDLPSGVALVERGRVVLFGPHPEFKYDTWWMLKRAYDFLVREWTPPEFYVIRHVALLLLKYGQI